MFVFVGPTLRPDEVTSAAAGTVCLPPVAQGDVYRAARQGPSAIGIIDGYFSGAPSVWHKEILWALAEGIPVFGSASMGALRAAELHDFGMQGVGRIFEAYRDGTLEDDDEVAVVHGPAETGFMIASEPMVNIRATLARAEVDGVISPVTRSRLEDAGKALFFPHRTWPAVLTAVGDDDVDLADFENWLPGGAVDQKRQDALEMLAAMHEAAPAGLAASADFRFERTHFWDDLVERAASMGPQAGWATQFPQHIIEELRLLGPGVYAAAERNALLRLLTEREARRRGSSLPMESRRAAATELRRALRLFSRSKLETWIGANDLDERSFEWLVETEAHRHAIAGSDRRLLEQYLLDELRLSDRYRQLAERARDKAQKLGSGLEGSLRGLPNTAQLRAWYFEHCLGCAIPDDVGAFAESLGFSAPAQLDRALLQEFVYTRLAGGGLKSFDSDTGEGMK